VAKVLLTTDGSDIALEAARRAVGLLGAGNEYEVLSVTPPPVAVGAPGATIDAMTAAVPNPETAVRLEEEERREAESAVEAATTALGIDARGRVAAGDPAVEICRLAQEEGFDLVVVGSHGRGWLQRVVLGSVSHHVVQHAKVPVLLVRHLDDDG
jgi:nucleotide-binding universal stress UspA family protein